MGMGIIYQIAHQAVVKAPGYRSVTTVRNRCGMSVYSV